MEYLIYARKFADSEERQILSIESQLQELRDFGKRENLEVVAEFAESKTAKEPGREVSNLILSHLEKKIEGILGWHPDRLARNSIDGGRITYLSYITFVKFQHYCEAFWISVAGNIAYPRITAAYHGSASIPRPRRILMCPKG